ncbi:putative smr domain-protein [Podospora aff. communis PSN243]|uniref:Smr domain-protein n=1 Tax=Podospora aff. communis PSN243 TaxID=3040156 RepID=A0AAV9G7A8_9PEZI|nr:putative smr domain-protein [Podospora aff. communis PSN243]
MASAGIALGRVSARAFNHSASNDAEAEYDRLRDLARSEGDKKKDCFERSQKAYTSGDGALAKELSEKGKRHQAKQAAYNKQASEFIFRENNSPGHVAEDTIDLHGQYVEEAENILEARIRDARARGQTHLHVIVGKGNHSSGGVQKVKPRVEQVCREMGLEYATEENAGRIYVDLTGGRISKPPPITQPGYPGGHGGQHHGGQHHQPPPQEQEGDLLWKIFRKLEKACCVVM